MPAFGIPKMHERLFLRFVDAATGLAGFLIRRLRLGCDRSQGLKGRSRQSRNELGVAKTFVVATVSEELGGVFEEETKMLGTDIRFLCETIPVSVAGAVE